MSRRILALLCMALCLLLTVSISLPAAVSSTGQAPRAEEKIYNFINPRGIQSPVQVVGLAPRLATIEGKNIYVNMSEADPVVMPALFEVLKKDYPKTNWKWLVSASETIEPAVQKDADAVIKGNAF